MKKTTDLATVGNYEFGSCFRQIIQRIAKYNPNRHVNEMKIKLYKKKECLSVAGNFSFVAEDSTFPWLHCICSSIRHSSFTSLRSLTLAAMRHQRCKRGDVSSLQSFATSLSYGPALHHSVGILSAVIQPLFYSLVALLKKWA